MDDYGFDPDLLVTKLPDLVCPICQMIPRNVYECAKCSAIYCEKCIKNWLKQKPECTNRCPGKNIKEAGLALKRVIRNLDIRCPECSKIVKVEDYDAHVKKCNQPKCCNDSCDVLEMSIKSGYKTIMHGKPKKACCLKCKYVAMLSESMGFVKEIDNSLYLNILRKAQELFTEYIKETDIHLDCEKKLNEVKVEFERHTKMTKDLLPSPIIAAMPGKNGLWEGALDPHYTAQGIVLSNNNKSAFLSEAGYCFRTVMGNTPMTSGVYYWEFQGDQRTENELKIGITGDRDFNFNTVSFSDHDFGYAFYGLAQLRHGNNSSGPRYGKSFKNVGTLGILLDMKIGQLSYALNGEYFGTAFTDEKLKKGPYYVACSLLHKAGFTLVTGKTVPPCFPK